MTYDYKKIWNISAPILAGLIIQQLIGLMDTAFLGRVGEIELGASAIAGVFYIMLFMFGHGFSIGAQIIIARRNGEQKLKKIGEVFYQGIVFLSLCSFILIFLTRITAPFILEKIISSPAVLLAVNDYLEPRIWGFIFAFAIVMFRSFYVGITNTRVLTYNALVMLLMNLVLDYVLIFGKWGFPVMGIRGAAIASVIAEAASLGFLIIYTIKNISFPTYGLHKIILWKNKLLKEILDISVWTIVQSFASIATWFMFFIAIEHLGEEYLAISNILRSLSTLLFMISAAFGAAANSITSNLIGANKDKSVMPTMKKIIFMTTAITFIFTVLMAAFPVESMRIYTDNIALIYRTKTAFFVMLSTYITLIPGFILFNAVSGTGHTKTAFFMEIISLVFYVAQILYIVTYLRADIAWCWTCEHSYNIVLSIISYAYMKSSKWHKKKV